MIKVDRHAVEMKGEFHELLAEVTEVMATLRKHFPEYSEKTVDGFFQEAVELSKCDGKQLIDVVLRKLDEALNEFKEALMKERDEMDEGDDF